MWIEINYNKQFFLLHINIISVLHIFWVNEHWMMASTINLK